MDKLLVTIIIAFSLITLTAQSVAANRGIELQAEIFKKSRNVAIVVGIEQYGTKSSGVSNLDYAVEDAVAIAEVLHKNHYAVKRLLNYEAGKHQILAQIAEAGKLVDKVNGTLFFSFSGHGFAENNINYLIVNGSTTSNLQQSALRVNDVINALKRTGVKRIVVFIDACRNIPGRKALNGGFITQQAGAGIQILVSTKEGELSWESHKLKKGVFSHFLVKGLQGAAAGNDNIVEFTKLAHYVESEVKKWSMENLNKVQQPYHYASGELYGRFVLATKRVEYTPLPDPSVNKIPTETIDKPITRFHDNRNGTISDNKTHLIWKKCVEGTSGNSCEQGIERAFKWQDTQFYRRQGWCLPSKEALARLIREDGGIFFPNTPRGKFWTGTTYGGDSYNAWVVDSPTGNSSILGKSVRSFARFVKCAR